MFGTDRGSCCGVAAAGGGDPADAHALRERRALPADVVSRARRARGAPPAVARPARAQRLRPLPRHRAGLPRARGGAAREQRLEPAAGADRAHRTGRRRLRARRSRHVRARARRHRASRARRAGGAARRSAHRPLVRAARLRRQRLRRRRRARRRDGVAERARRRLDGDLRPAPRAGAPPAQRAAPVSDASRARRVPPLAARAPRGHAARGARAVLSARPGLGRAAGAGRGGGALPRRDRRERRGPGAVRDGLPPRRRARSAAAPARRGARARDDRRPARARTRLDRSGAHERDADARGRGRGRADGVSRRRHARRRALLQPTPSCADVVHAEGPDRVAARGARAAAGRRLPRRGGARPVVAGRSRRRDARRSRSPSTSSTTRCSATSPAGPRCRSASSSSPR